MKIGFIQRIRNWFSSKEPRLYMGGRQLKYENIPPEEVDAYMEKLLKKVKKVPYEECSGSCDYSLRFNLKNMTESIWIPVR